VVKRKRAKLSSAIIDYHEPFDQGLKANSFSYFLFLFFCVRKLLDDLSPTIRGSLHYRKSVRTNSPATKSSNKGLEPRQNKIDEKGQSVVKKIALKNGATVVNASLRHDLFAPEFKDALAR